MKRYKGERTFDAIVVTVDDRALDARRDLNLFTENHFEWGYEGDESRQLALAILADCQTDDVATKLTEPFMREIVANFGNEWEITSDQVLQAVADLTDH